MTALTSLAIILISIYILVIITEFFFIKSLDTISEIWKLPHNVAGASLMAIGSSAPELSIAIFALFKDGGAHSDVGIGTIVGSAVFNILVICGIASIIRKAEVTLPVIARDTFFYIASIVLLFFAFKDGEITLPESIFFIVLYAVYIAVLFLLPANDNDIQDNKIAEEPHNTNRLLTLNNLVVKIVGYAAGDGSVNYIRSFIISILCIIGLSWILVDYTVIFANAVGIPPVIIALTVLAAGTSAPDLISSIIVVKQGRGSMAIANAIGSNIFDILIGLGLPWLIALFLFERPLIKVGTDDLMLSVMILIGTVIILFAFISITRQLNKKQGWCLLAIYTAYITWMFISG